MLIWELYVKRFFSSNRYGELHMKHFSSSHGSRAFTWTSFSRHRFWSASEIFL